MNLTVDDIINMSDEEITAVNKKLAKKLVIRTAIATGIAALAVTASIIIANKLETQPYED